MMEYATHARRHIQLSLALAGIAFGFEKTAIAGDDSSASLDTVTVTATKQRQSTRDVNLSATVVSAEALAEAEVRSTDQLARVLPDLQISSSGDLLFPVISLRGVTSAQDYYNPALSIYVDGVPQLPVSSIQALTDIDRVELLRGPQGTLYGRSAQGGIINIVTRRPDATNVNTLSLGLASRESYHAMGSASGMLLADTLYGSVTVLSQEDPGDLSNPATRHDDLGGTRSQSGAARLLWARPGSPWEFDLAAKGDCSRAYQDVYVPFDRPDQRSIPHLDSTPDPRLHRCGHSEALSALYRAGEWELTAIGSLQQLHYSRSFPYFNYVVETPERWRQNTQEIRVATAGGHRAWDAVAGFYRQDVDQERDSTIYPFSPVRTQAPVNSSSNESETLALYADGTWHATDRLDIGAGARVSRDRAATHFQNEYLSVTLFQGAGSEDAHHLLGQLSAGYTLTEHWRLYARLAEGYKPVGFNLAPSSLADARPFDAETSVNYEVGTYAEWSSMSLRAAVYRARTQDMQLYVGEPGAQHIANAGQSHAHGAEAGLRWRLAPKWLLGVDGTVTSAEFDDIGLGSTASYADKRLPFISRYSGSVYLETEIATPFGSVLPALDVRSVGSRYFDVANTLKQPAYTTLDLRLSWKTDRAIELSVYAHNLTDRIYRTYAFQSPAGPLAQTSFGRTVGVTFLVSTRSP